jgi:hypothetical protein
LTAALLNVRIGGVWHRQPAVRSDSEPTLCGLTGRPIEVAEPGQPPASDGCIGCLIAERDQVAAETGMGE